MTTLKSILEKYKQNGEDEQRFMDKHTENVSVLDGPGVEEIQKAARGVSAAKHIGYKSDEDETVYESTDRFSIEDIKAVLVTEDIDEDIIERVENHLLEASPSYFMQIIDSAVHSFREEATDEERAVIDEMLSTEEGYQELVGLIFEEDEDDDEDDDEDEDDDDEDDDDEVIDANPKMKKEKKSNY